MLQRLLVRLSPSVLLIVLSSALAAEAPVLNAEWADRLFNVDRISQDAVEQGEAIGVETLLIQDGVILLHRTYGVEDVDTKEPLAPGAIWSVKSMTKPMVALAVLMLVDDGKVALHEPIETWLPEFAGDKRVTVSDLLSHRSGVEGLGNSSRPDWSLRQWTEAWAKRPPAGPMGQYRYSDFNFAVAALIISERSGMSVEEYITDRILTPIGMEDAHLTFDPSFDWASRVPSRYVKRDGVFQEAWDQADPIWYPFFPGGWGLWASASDYAKFVQFWLDRGSVDGRQIIDPALIDLALTPHTRQVDGNWSYGLGWFLHGTTADRSRPLAFYHDGYDGTRANAYPETNSIALVLTHSRGAVLFPAIQNELLAVSGLGAKSPRTVLLDELEWTPLNMENAAAHWVGNYSGIAYLGARGFPVDMVITRQGENLGWSAKIKTPSGVNERTALFVAENSRRGWLADDRDGAPFFIRCDRKMEFGDSGRLLLMSGERIIAEVQKTDNLDHATQSPD